MFQLYLKLLNGQITSQEFLFNMEQLLCSEEILPKVLLECYVIVLFLLILHFTQPQTQEKRTFAFWNSSAWCGGKGEEALFLISQVGNKKSLPIRNIGSS